MSAITKFFNRSKPTNDQNSPNASNDKDPVISSTINKDEKKSNTDGDELEYPPKPLAKPKGPKILNILVCDGDPTHNWPKLFENIKLPWSNTSSSLNESKEEKNEYKIHVYQCSWNKCDVTSYSDSCNVLIQPIHSTVKPEKYMSDIGFKDAAATIEFKPHFVIVRNQPRGAIPVTDCRNAMFGLMYANIPSINNWNAIYSNLERSIMFGGLKSIENKYGNKYFPLIDATYYSNYKRMIISPSMPAIIKMSHAHAGMGKIKVDDQTGLLNFL